MKAVIEPRGSCPPSSELMCLPSALVEKFHLDITRDECQQLLVKYDLKNNGKFAYCSFMQSCVLLLKAKETSLMQRMKIQNANKMVCGSPGGQGWGRASWVSFFFLSSS